jgi:hypothetical protein
MTPGLAGPGGKRALRMSSERVTPLEARDSALLAAAAAGDDRAWDELVGRYAQLVWDVARSYRLDPVATADVCTITWLRCVDRLDDISRTDDLARWLSENTAIEARRVACLGAAVPLTMRGGVRPPDELRVARGRQAAP